jgi:NAD(P)-dependent dehydrogenase (short-subunit alcohol dehydrogenase family)
MAHPADPLDLSGRVVLVTGGGRGIGRGITDRFLAAGATVAICGRTEPADAGGATFHACDVRDPDQVAALVDAVVAQHGRLDVVVNNAGGAPPVEAATASPRLSESIVRLNLLGPLNVAQRANAVMQSQPDGGSIINIASVSGVRPSPGSAAYGAAKAGLLSLTQSLAIEWAPKVRVNAVVAGMVLTEDSREFYGDDDKVARIAATVPLGRFADPDDVASACLFLASPLSTYMTGSSLLLHGGGDRPAWMTALEG